jgi:ferredoxin
MALRVLGACIGCGACESACGQQAISQAEAFAVVYQVDPLLCNDCHDCLAVCPVDALVPDPHWAMCFGRGCPLGSARYRGWACSQGLVLCPSCGSMMWQPPGGEWVCSACRLGAGAQGARCPKVEQARRMALGASSAAPVRSSPVTPGVPSGAGRR